jgi:transcriptional regulator with XRE-family HTH domain
MSELSTYLKFLRFQNGWSQKQVAEQLSLSVPAFSKLEGGRTDLSLSRLLQLADIYGISLTELLSCGKRPSSTLQPQINSVRSMLNAREQEILELRAKIISLLEEIEIRNKGWRSTNS